MTTSQPDSYRPSGRDDWPSGYNAGWAFETYGQKQSFNGNDASVWGRAFEVGRAAAKYGKGLRLGPCERLLRLPSEEFEDEKYSDHSPSMVFPIISKGDEERLLYSLTYGSGKGGFTEFDLEVLLRDYSTITVGYAAYQNALDGLTCVEVTDDGQILHCPVDDASNDRGQRDGEETRE